MIPTNDECFLLMSRYEMLDNIRAHSLVVAKVAHLLARTLFEAGVDISVETVTAGALMHDIGKTASLKTGQDHSKIGRQICIENNLHDIADIVGEHVRLKDYDLNGGYSAKEIVFYSDKRVTHDTIVSLEDRLSYIIERYGRNQEDLQDKIRANFELCKRVETKLFSRLHFAADQLVTFAKDEDIG